MAIDESGKWWKGSTPQDMDEYIRLLSQEHYPIDDFRLSSCICGGLEFKLDFDKNEGCAKRKCLKCETEHFICDSEEHAEDADFETWSCIECRSSSTNVSVGYALRSAEDIKWIYIVGRCSLCGVLGCYADWKIDFSPSLHLLEQA